MNEEIKVHRIANLEQVNFYLSMGCRILRVEIEWSERYGKMITYCLFNSMDLVYQKSKFVWDKKLRL